MKEDAMASQSIIPEWILQCLDQYGNCACGRAITKKLGKDKLLEELEELGYPCELEILSDLKENNPYPKDGTYILMRKNRQILSDDDLEEAY